MYSENVYRQELVKKYREAMGNLFRYIPWFEEKSGMKTVQTYSGNDRPSNSVPIPVYDSTLLAFVKEMQKTGLMNRNYVYVYTRCRIKNVGDELRAIEKTELKDIEVIFAVMSKYVLGGMTKGILWSQAVENDVFLHALRRLKELLEVRNEI